MPNASINFDSVRTQVINGISIGRVVKSINTDINGNLSPNQWTQMLVVSITICDQYGNCGAPFSAIIPNTATAQFGNMIMGAFITQTIPPSSASGQIFGVNSGNTPEWETVSGGVGTCSFVWNSTGSYTLNCPGYAPKASPTFTGTVTMPDAATWTSTGISSLTALGIGTAAPTGGTALAINRSFAGSALETITNSNTATNAQAGFQASNGTSNALFAETGTAATGNPPANSLYLTNNGAGGMYISTTGGNYPIVFAPNGVQQGFFSGSGLTLAQPLAIGSGGLGSATAPALGQILIAQSATVYAPETMSGDATISSTGAVAVGKIGGITYGGAGTAGQVLIAQSASGYAPETITGDVNVTSPTGVTNVVGLHFGGSAVGLAALATPPPANTIPYFTGTTMTASGALTNNLPIIFGVSGPTTGARSGNTTTFGTTAGTLIANDCLKTDSNGNIVDAGGACGISGGPTFPNGSPPQIAGYAAANISEAETVSGDFTFARAGLNSYVATVTKLSGTVPGGSCAANTYVSSISASAVPTCGPALNGIYAPLASPTFTGTVTLPDSSAWASTGLTMSTGSTFTPPDGSKWTSAGLSWATATGKTVTLPDLGIATNQGISKLTHLAMNGPLASTETDPILLNSVAKSGSSVAGPGSVWDTWLTTDTPPIAQGNISWGLYGATAGWTASAQNVAHIAVNKGEIGMFQYEGLTVGSIVNGPWAQYLALRDSAAGSGQGLFLTKGQFISVAASGGTGAGGVCVGCSSASTNDINVSDNFNGSALVMVNNGNAGTSTQAGYGATNGVSGVNLWLNQTGPGYTAGLGPNVGYLYADRKLALQSGAQDTSPMRFDVGGNHLLDLDWGHDLGGFTGIHIIPNTWSQFIEGPNGSQGISISSIGANNFNITAGAYYNGTNWVANSTAQAPLMNAGQGQFGFYRQPVTWSTPVGSNLGGWVPAAKFDGSWNFDHVQSDPDVPAPTVTAGASLGSGSRDFAGEIILSATMNYVDLTYSRCYPNTSWCVANDDGEGYFWIVSNKGNCSVRFNCMQAAGTACTAGAHYVNYICAGY